MKLRYKALLLVLLIVVLAAVGLVSCNPGKKLLQVQDNLEALNFKQQAHDRAVAAKAVGDYVGNNPCQPMPVINLDSLCSIYYQCPGVADKSPAGDYFESKPVSYSKPKTVLVPWEDKRTINLYKDSIAEKDQRLAVLNALMGTKDAECRETVRKAVDDVKSGRKLLWWITGLLALFFGICIRNKK